MYARFREVGFLGQLQYAAVDVVEAHQMLESAAQRTLLGQLPTECNCRPQAHLCSESHKPTTLEGCAHSRTCRRIDQLHCCCASPATRLGRPRPLDTSERH